MTNAWDEKLAAVEAEDEAETEALKAKIQAEEDAARREAEAEAQRKKIAALAGLSEDSTVMNKLFSTFHSKQLGHKLFFLDGGGE